MVGEWLANGLQIVDAQGMPIGINAGGDVWRLTEAEFEELRNILIPPQKESWTTIPWNLNLLKAQAKAGAERKPIFIWAMNGHPMACV